MQTQPHPLQAEATLRALADHVLQASQAEATEVVLVGQTSHLTRFANNQVHQNVAETDLRVRIRVAFGQRVGEASTNDTAPEALVAALRDAEALARLQPDDPDFPGFTGPQAFTPIPEALDAGTLACEAADRASAVAHVCRLARAQDMVAAGAFQTGLRQRAIATSAGLWAHHAGSFAHLDTVVMSDDSSGWAADTHADARRIDGEALGAEAVEKAARSRRPQDLEPGEYPVLLEPYAVVELLSYMGRAFGAEDVREGRSFLAGHVGAQLVHPAVTVVDDPRDPAGLASPFDHEGVPATRRVLFERGVAGAPVYDRRAAAREGLCSTGHHFGGGAFWKAAPLAAHLAMGAGEASREALLGGMERGVYVTRFHYVNQLDARRTLLTGMTRDGTFWVENGRIVRPLRNMRFTHAWLDVLRDIEAIGADQKLNLNWYGGASRAPALRVGRLRFTGRTTF
ncbi:MAG: TldD/PmbA family protein [Candidatus Sericytochromatia bacterium]|nr:TldD/PmbA family protein [Candidatus Sericytochromatia bacterium]